MFTSFMGMERGAMMDLLRRSADKGSPDARRMLAMMADTERLRASYGASGAGRSAAKRPSVNTKRTPTTSALSAGPSRGAPPVSRLPDVRPFTSECLLLSSYPKAGMPIPSDGLVRHYQNAVRSSGGVALVLLQDEIVDSPTARGITATSFCSTLDAAAAAGAKSLHLSVDSRGGVATEALAICRALRRFSNEVGPVVASVERQADSGASLAALAADYCVVSPVAKFHVHDPQGGPRDRRAHLRNAIERIYVERTLLPANKMAEYMAAGVDIEASPAWTYGFADEVADDASARASLIAKQAATPGGLYSRSIAAGRDGQAVAYSSWRQRVLADRKRSVRS